MRSADWPQRLAAYLESRRAAPFVWGTHDCCQFANGAVIAMTGVDRMPGYTYETELGAARLIRRAGTLDALVCRALGEPIHASQAGRGDVVICDLENGSTLGICLGETCAFAADAGGVTFRPRSMIRAAWGIN